MEVNTLEETHVLCLFDSLAKILKLDAYVYEHLPAVKNAPEKLGDQVIVNEYDEVIAVKEKYLGSATDIAINDLQKIVLESGGLFIPAHVNRKVFSLSSNLGFIPQSENFSAVEIYKTSYLNNTPEIPLTEYPMISNSDAHSLDQIGIIWNEIEVQEFSVESLGAALLTKQNKICIA
jgi:PHP family Zn ribbon phosphoesterase